MAGVRRFNSSRLHPYSEQYGPKTRFPVKCVLCGHEVAEASTPLPKINPRELAVEGERFGWLVYYVVEHEDGLDTGAALGELRDVDGRPFLTPEDHRRELVTAAGAYLNTRTSDAAEHLSMLAVEAAAAVLATKAGADRRPVRGWAWEKRPVLKTLVAMATQLREEAVAAAEKSRG